MTGWFTSWQRPSCKFARPFDQFVFVFLRLSLSLGSFLFLIQHHDDILEENFGFRSCPASVSWMSALLLLWFFFSFLFFLFWLWLSRYAVLFVGEFETFLPWDLWHRQMPRNPLSIGLHLARLDWRHQRRTKMFFRLFWLFFSYFLGEGGGGGLEMKWSKLWLVETSRSILLLVGKFSIPSLQLLPIAEGYRHLVCGLVFSVHLFSQLLSFFSVCVFLCFSFYLSIWRQEGSGGEDGRSPFRFADHTDTSGIKEGSFLLDC